MSSKNAGSGNGPTFGRADRPIQTHNYSAPNRAPGGQRSPFQRPRAGDLPPHQRAAKSRPSRQFFLCKSPLVRIGVTENFLFTSLRQILEPRVRGPQRSAFGKRTPPRCLLFRKRECLQMESPPRPASGKRPCWPVSRYLADGGEVRSPDAH